MMEKPYSQASENNKTPILKILQRVLRNSAQVLEIGSGTGQHAAFFADALPHLTWQPSDQATYLPGIQCWCDDYRGNNLRTPIELDVRQEQWPTRFDAVFSANTAHIMAWQVALKMIQNVAEYLQCGGIFALYGPFNYCGRYTSDSNASFDKWLRQRDPHSGIRDFEKVNDFACNLGLMFLEDNPMPANNRLLVWQKSPISDTGG